MLGLPVRKVSVFFFEKKNQKTFSDLAAEMDHSGCDTGEKFRMEYHFASCFSRIREWWNAMEYFSLGFIILSVSLVIGQFCQIARADDLTSPQVTSTISETARYEIVQSELAAKGTFRLDRFCGGVSQYVSTQDGGYSWENMPVENRPACSTDGRPHYQLFLSSIAMKFSFLMNTDTGETWLLSSVKLKDGSIEDVWLRIET